MVFFFQEYTRLRGYGMSDHWKSSGRSFPRCLEVEEAGGGGWQLRVIEETWRTRDNRRVYSVALYCRIFYCSRGRTAMRLYSLVGVPSVGGVNRGVRGISSGSDTVVGSHGARRVHWPGARSSQTERWQQAVRSGLDLAVLVGG